MTEKVSVDLPEGMSEADLQKAIKAVQSAKGDSSFKEVDRVRVSDDTHVVLSECYKGEVLRGLTINKYVDKPKFTGFTKGVFIPEELIPEFLSMFSLNDLEAALDSKESVGE